MNSIHPSASLYRDTIIQDSIIGQHSTIGDFSRVRNSFIHDYCCIDRQNFLLHVNLGARSYTGPWDMLFHCNIGRYCSISYGVTIGPPDHSYHRISTHPFYYNSKFGLFPDDGEIIGEKFSNELVLGNDIWVGCNVTILRGLTIGDGAIIGANSVVTQSVPPYAIVAGTPARVIKYRFEDRIIEKLLDLRWWDWDDATIQRNKNLFYNNKVSLKDLDSVL
jgi:acetyltransferase-like isoleucine patch superfamily enzyme